MSTTYKVEVRRDPEDARFWLADVEGLAGAHASSRSLATLDRYVRDVVVLAAGLPDEDAAHLRLEWIYRTGDARLDAEAQQVRRLRTELDAATAALSERTAALARRLVQEHRFSVREAAALLGVSSARVDQLLREGSESRAGSVADGAQGATSRREGASRAQRSPASAQPRAA